MLTQTQRRDLFATLAKTAALWKELFESWAVEDTEGAHEGALGPEEPTLKPIPEANGNGRKKVEILSERRPGTPESHYTMSDAVELTGYSRGLLMSMIDSGTLGHRRGSSPKRPRIYIPEAEVLRLMEEKEKAEGLRFVTAGRGVVYPP
jgi:hypothetical protein